MNPMMSKVLVANRGEIAIRILRAAEELGWDTVAIYTESDTSHATFAHEAVKLDSVADFLNIERIINIARSTQCTHLHPGYGFLSESPALAQALSEAQSLDHESPIIFIGPSIETLRISSDKMLSRNLAASLDIHVAPGIRVSSSNDVRVFARNAGYPVMIKALDGGGGRGIRAVKNADDVSEAFQRCLGESPSKQLFVEKALTGQGWKHIEVQIVGNGAGDVMHLWERECSVQRRFQKIVEMAPSTLSRDDVQPLLKASLKMAKSLNYHGLGTFEYLSNTHTKEWAFLEINPRVQVEHTVTEEITNLDLVRTQLLLSSPSVSLSSLGLHSHFPLHGYAIQLRLTAEDPSHSFRLSPGTIRPSDITWPAGRGVRIDTWLSTAFAPGLNSRTVPEWIVGPDFDSLLAKIIVRGSTFEEATQRAKRVLKELRFGGDVKTNIELLAGVVEHRDWAVGGVDTMWLERNAEEVTKLGKELLFSKRPTKGLETNDSVIEGTGHSTTPSHASNVLLQPGALFHLTLSPSGTAKPASETIKHTLTLSSIALNTFPENLSGTIQTTLSPTPLSFTLTQSSSAALSSPSSFELADPNNPNHLASPLTGKIVELHPALLANDGRRLIKKGETLVVLSVMKMESVVTSPVSGVIERKGEGVQVGVILGEGMLVGIISGDTQAARSRL